MTQKESLWWERPSCRVLLGWRTPSPARLTHFSPVVKLPESPPGHDQGLRHMEEGVPLWMEFHVGLHLEGKEVTPSRWAQLASPPSA